MGDDIPFTMMSTLTFEEIGGKTRMTLHHVGFPAGEMSEMTVAGLTLLLREGIVDGETVLSQVRGG